MCLTVQLRLSTLYLLLIAHFSRMTVYCWTLLPVPAHVQYHTHCSQAAFLCIQVRAVGLVAVWSYIASLCAKRKFQKCTSTPHCMCSEVVVLQTLTRWKSQSTSLPAVKGGCCMWDPFTTWHSSQLNKLCQITTVVGTLSIYTHVHVDHLSY